jgi:hypothetical protein
MLFLVYTCRIKSVPPYNQLRWFISWSDTAFLLTAMPSAMVYTVAKLSYEHFITLRGNIPVCKIWRKLWQMFCMVHHLLNVCWQHKTNLLASLNWDHVRLCGISASLWFWCCYFSHTLIVLAVCTLTVSKEYHLKEILLWILWLIILLRNVNLREMNTTFTLKDGGFM